MTGDREKAWAEHAATIAPYKVTGELRDHDAEARGRLYRRGFDAGWDAALTQRTVTTVDELDALPVGSVIDDARHWVFARFRVAESDNDDDFDADGLGRPAWWLCGHEGEFPALGILLPCRVLFTPGGDHE